MKSVVKKSIRDMPFYRLLISLIAIIFVSEVLIILIATPASPDKLSLSLIDATVLSLITLITVLPFLIIFKKLSIATEDALAEAFEDLRHQKFALDQHAIVATTDVQGTITYVNEKFCAISGYEQAELIGQNHRMLNSGTHPTEFFREMYRTIASGKVWSGEICNRAKDGSLYWVMSTIVPSLGSNGKPTEYIAIRADITERKNAEEAVRQLAFYDALTKLPNRRMLHERLSHALQLSKRSTCYGALMFLDLDNFKPLNDTYGHAVGDVLLIQTASRLKNCVREIDVVARFGGDEFVVMISELDVDELASREKANTVAEKIQLALSEPYLLKANQIGLRDTEIEHHCTASIGVSLFGNDKANQNDIMKWADDAMYQAKAAGRNMIRFYDMKD